MDDLAVGGYLIPANELAWRFDPSGGPGGQHANRSSTRAELRFDLTASAVFPPDLQRWMLERLGSRARDGVVVVVADQTRSQWRNRLAARRRLASLLEDSMEQRPSRRATRPTRAARARRLEDKRRRSERKRLRRPPDAD